jgi:hypothetical protein
MYLPNVFFLTRFEVFTAMNIQVVIVWGCVPPWAIYSFLTVKNPVTDITPPRIRNFFP